MVDVAVERGAATLRDGGQLAYAYRKPSGAASRRIVLIHSLGLDSRVWDGAASAIVRSEVVAYDCRGHGASSPAPGPYNLELFADDLADLMDGIGWESAIVGGASMGGMVAQAFAARYPGRADALALVDTTAWYGPDAAQAWGSRARQAEEEGLRSLIDFHLSKWFSEAFAEHHDSIVQELVAAFVRTDATCYAAACRMLGEADLRPSLADLAVPTVVIVGEHDDATPVSMAEALHRAIGGSSLHVLPEAGHLTPVEQPTAVAQILLDELSGTPTT